uniref:Hedgling n=1 Tax=Amphimedon queenslandica TaxID=400682 RepID=A9YRX2_AMPQE|nr:hedgling [Amphimedon queenslandica]
MTTRLYPTLLLFFLLSCIFSYVAATNYNYGKGPLPSKFTKGKQWPAHGEQLECRPIQLHIARGSKRYKDLVVYSSQATYLHFASSDCRIMSSRLYTRLSSLAEAYYWRYHIKILVLKAWTPYPDYSLDNTSLHYEGRSVRIHVTSRNVTRLLKMAVSAGFDWVMYDKKGYARMSVIPDACDTNLDVVFVLDQSGSIGYYNHQLALNFLSKVVEFFKIGANKTQVGLITYSTHAYVQFDLNDYHSKSTILNRISRIYYTGGWTATALGLFQAGVILNPQQMRGARPISQGVPRVVILLTDGRSNRVPIDEVAPSLHDFGIQVYTVGVGNIYLPELKFIASDPDPYHIFLLDSFSDASGFVDFLSSTTCDTPAVVEPGENTTTEVPEDGFRFFQTECNAFSVSVVVEQIDLYGKCHLYASTSKPNPGPLDNSSVVVRNEDLTSDRRFVIVKGVKKFIYISIRGIRVKNMFTVIIWDMLFNQEVYSINVPEGIPNQHIFNLTSEISVTTESYYFRIKNGNDNDDFMLNNITGLLFVRNPLSIARQQYYHLVIIAENRNASCHRGKVTIKINVIPDELEFGNLQPVSIPENATGIVTRVTANGNSSSITYSITGGNTGNSFVIDANTGDISVANNSVLDHETVPLYQLNVQARSSLGATATATQIINILDINEAPVFTNSCALANECRFFVLENVTLSGLVGYLVATDPDLATVPNGQLNYTLVASETVPFTIDNSGRITLNGTLDRETRDLYQFTVIVMDNGSPSLSIRTTATVRVLDVNDNAPEFVQGRTFLSIPEDTPIGRPIEQYIVVDDDIGINSLISYRLESSLPSIPFSINNNALLTVSGPLDADEGITLYNFTIFASNFDGLGTSFNVSVEITDVNDNAPQFPISPIRANVTEHVDVGTSVVQVVATDIDSGSNAEISYSIILGNLNGAFAINNKTGLITVNADIDRELVNEFTLTVQAEDLGEPSRLRNTTAVIITVNDINDNPPVFMPSTINLTFPENQALGSLNITISATDNDEPGNPNSIITYSITSGNDGNSFSINSATGLLSLVSSLDFEVRNNYSLVVEGRDNGDPTMTGTALVNVAVTNVNDHPPVITRDVEITVPENTPINSSLAQFNATDLDQMTVHFCFADGSNSNGLFAIDSKTGVVTLVSSLDFETARVHVLVIKANDSIHTDNATLTVNVLDVNEFAPQFVGPVSFEVGEANSTGDVVGKVMATDRDGSDTVMYFLESNSISGLFSLDSSTGIITTRSPLDREGLVEEGHFLPPDSSESVTVLAVDSGTRPGPLRTEQNITIRLLDINDNSPVFNPSSYTTTIPENVNEITALFNVSATDADLGNNSVIRYSLSVSDDFSIDPVTGTVFATSPFDREDVNLFNFMIIATDQGNPSLSGSASATVRVTDVNDNPPQFSTNFDYEREVAEDTQVGAVLTQIIVVDDDQGLNAMVTITSREGDNNCSTSSECFFRINNNGIVQLVRQLDYETQQQHNVTLIAVDSGSPSLSSTQLLIFNVINVDEAEPEFLGPCDSSVLEDSPSGTIVTSCPARDFDEVTGEFTDDIRYSIIRGNEELIFSIDEDGNITTDTELDKESRDQYTITIQAADSGNLRTTMDVVITVLDVNDHSPELAGPYEVLITDSDINNYRSFVVNVSATDRDIGNNAAIVYSITDTEIEDQFAILTINATDRGSPVALSDSTFVNVTFESSCLAQDYQIDSVTGVISGQFLCRISISPPLVQVSINETITLHCDVFRNADVSVQLLRNGSEIGSATLLGSGDSRATFTRENATLSDAGIYNCKATSFTTLQTFPGSNVQIHVPARITVPPSDVTANIGQAFVRFICQAEGIPNPTFSWRRESEVVEASGRISLSGNQLVIAQVDLLDSGTYTCIASNPAGSDSASAELNVFGALNLLVAQVVALSNPDPVQNCNSFDAQKFEKMMTQITNHKTMVTQSDGSTLCQSDSCHPNPCVNGTCNVTSDGYQCTCTPGFIGTNCDMDKNECEDPALCRNGGTCENVPGGFMCHCADGYFGEMCLYNHGKCDCPPGTTCASTDAGSTCVVKQSGDNLIIDDPTVTNIVSLENTVNTLLEDPPSSSEKRRKREGFVTVCSGYFVRLSSSSNTYMLVWECPDESQPPDSAKMTEICQTLVRLQLVKVCHPPEGSPISLRDVPPSDVDVTLVLFDSNGRLMSSDDAMKILNNDDVVNKMRESGYNISGFRQVSPTISGVGASSSNKVAETVGIVTAIALVMIVAVIIIAALIVRYKKKNKRIRVPMMELDEKVVSRDDDDRYGPGLSINLPINDTSITSDKVASSPLSSPTNPYALFDDPIYSTKPARRNKSVKKSTLERAKQHQMGKSSSLEKLLDEEDDSPVITKSLEDGDEPIYGNMNFECHGNAGERWQNYWKTETIIRGTTPPM